MFGIIFLVSLGSEAQSIIALKYVLPLSNSVLGLLVLGMKPFRIVEKKSSGKGGKSIVSIWNSYQNFDLGSLTTFDHD